MHIFKEGEAPAVYRDEDYPPWIWDQTAEPTYKQLLEAEFESLPRQYQKKIWKIPRQEAIKQNNESRAKH